MIENLCVNTKDFKIKINNIVLVFNYFNKKYYIGYYKRSDSNTQYMLQSEILVINANELDTTGIEDYFKISLKGCVVTGDYDIKYPRVAPLSFECVMKTINIFGEYQFNFANSEYWLELNRENNTLMLTDLEKSYVYDFSSIQVFKTFYHCKFVINFIPTLEIPCYNKGFQTGEKKLLKQMIEKYDEAILKDKDGTTYELCYDDKYYIIQKQPEISRKLEFNTKKEQISQILKILHNNEVSVYSISARQSSANFTPRKLKNILRKSNHYNFINAEQELRVMLCESMYILQTGFRKVFFSSFEDMMRNKEFPIKELLENERIA